MTSLPSMVTTQMRLAQNDDMVRGPESGLKRKRAPTEAAYTGGLTSAANRGGLFLPAQIDGAILLVRQAYPHAGHFYQSIAGRPGGDHFSGDRPRPLSSVLAYPA
jgi:hypothetical protein